MKDLNDKDKKDNPDTGQAAAIDDKSKSKHSEEQSENKTPADDATQFQPPKKKAVADDATQFQPPKKPAVADDATQFKPPKKKAAVEDATQFKAPSSKPSDDQTNTSKTSSPLGQNTESTYSADKQRAEESGDLLKDRFILEKVLGAGGMGVVYQAKDLVKIEAGDKEPYLAIKVLTDEFKEHPEAFVALQRESRKTQRIAHPNIVNVHDFDKDGDTVFMTMEFLEGKPLDKLIQQYKSTGLPTDDAMTILKGVSRALIHAHEHNIIHSDFKPGNIFVTDRGVTKVFDFGIARAVAKAEHYEENLDDKTIFDAGDLGALTPSYASYEMLEGMEPDVRDDIYALGCVAYELFTGSHPFNKIPADEAKRQNLKPKRINHIPRRQWRAIEKSLSFERDDRVASVKDFLELISEKEKSLVLPIAIVLSTIIAAVGFFQFFGEQPSSISEVEIRSELEYNLRLENYRNVIDNLMVTPEFSDVWQGELWLQVQGVRKLLETSDKWLETTTNEQFKVFLQTSSQWREETEKNIYSQYITKISAAREAKNLSIASSLIDNAYRYTEDTSQLDEEKKLLAAAVAEQKRVAEESRQKKIALEARRLEESKKVVSKPKPKTGSSTGSKSQQFAAALDNVQKQINCQSNRINMRNLDTALQKLRSVDSSRYLKLEKDLVTSLVNCIKRVSKPFPERAAEFKKQALRIFKHNKKIAAITIEARDPCDKSLAGLGARGKRATCRDSIEGIGNGPDLVVIPGGKGIKTFALGKYEVSIEQLNVFCRSSRSCQQIKSSNASAPVTNVSLKVVESYLRWISKNTKRKYRLPTKSEWLYAAKGKRVSLDPNRNCKLNTRGISKGDKFVRNSVGAQNGWGLVNYVGNASEWVYDKGRKLVAAGGSYNIPMEQCNLSTFVPHDGKADSFTGFRIYREIK